MGKLESESSMIITGSTKIITIGERFEKNKSEWPNCNQFGFILGSTLE